MQVIGIYLRSGFTYRLGVKDISMIAPVKTDDKQLWYDVFKKGERWARINAKAIDIIRYAADSRVQGLQEGLPNHG
jgi:hypothetical protein